MLYQPERCQSLALALITKILWPFIFVACVSATAYGIHIGYDSLVFSITYLLLGLVLWQLERLLPFERSWLINDGQIWPDFLHTIFSKLFAYYVTVSVASLGLLDLFKVWDHFWPNNWPLFFQVCLGLVIAEFGFYWAHRISHVWPPMWRFHSVHHSVTRLWFFNTGRFHLGDTLRSMVFSLPLMFMLGAPQIIFTWVGAVTAIIGLLTHCNIEMDNRYISWLFNTPNLHRWHHSKNAVEGNTNYGENLMLWDWVFGSYYNTSKRPPAEIGIKEQIPSHYLGQVIAPFKWEQYRIKSPR